MKDTQAQRERLTETILSEISNELDILFRSVPEMAEQDQQSIKTGALTEARRILDSLSSDELRSRSALARFIETTVAAGRMKLHLLLFEQHRKKS